jgi:hypothetical protein
MVLVKMLMKIALPKMGELLVMTAVTISPSRREVSPAEQLCRSPRLVSASVPPRDGGVWSRKPPYDFFQVKTPHIGEDGHRGAMGGHEAGGAPPTLVDRVWAPWYGSSCRYFLYFPK